MQGTQNARNAWCGKCNTYHMYTTVMRYNGEERWITHGCKHKETLKAKEERKSRQMAAYTTSCPPPYHKLVKEWREERKNDRREEEKKKMKPITDYFKREK